MIEKICIRKANEADYPQVMDIIGRAFRDEPYSGRLSLAEMRGTKFFIPELSLVAETDDHKIVGHIYLIKVFINRTFTSLGLAQVVVAPEHQRRRIGSLMMVNVHQKAKEMGYNSIVALGHKEFLSKFGYREAADFGIHFPYGVVEEQCLIVELSPGALTYVHGLVRFPFEYM